MTNFNQLLFALGYCFLMIALSFIFLKFPPKKINALYGYRTHNSMKNQQTWDVANSYWTTLFFKLNLVALLIPFMVYFTFPEFTFLFTIIASTIILLATLPVTEKHLKKKFNEDGNRI